MVRHGRWAIAIASLLLLTACIGQPAGSPHFAVGATSRQAQGTGLTVDLNGVFGRARHLASAVDEIETVLVKVGSTTQTASRADFSAGKTQLVFTGLPAGKTSLLAEAFDAAGVSRGYDTRVVEVYAGVQTPVSMIMRVRDAFAGPSHDPSTLGGIQAGITLVDGPVVYGAQPTPRPLPSTVPFTDSDYLFEAVGDSFSDMTNRLVAVSDSGHIATSGMDGVTFFDPSATLIPLQWAAGEGADFYAYIHLDRQNNLWVVDAFASPPRVCKFDATGARQVSVTLAGNIFIYTPESYFEFELRPPRCLVTDDAGNAWVANGSQVTKLSPTGAVLGNYPVGAPVNDLDRDPTTGTLWITHRHAARVSRMAPDGTLLSTTLLSAVGDEANCLRVDRSGNAWIGEQWTRRIAKVAPDGTLEGHVELQYPVYHLELDPQGHLLALAEDGLFQIDGDGSILKRYPGLFSPNFAVDSAGSLYTTQQYFVVKTTL